MYISETFSLGIQYIILLSSINHITCLNVWDECNCLILRLLNNTVFNKKKLHWFECDRKMTNNAG